MRALCLSFGCVPLDRWYHLHMLHGSTLYGRTFWDTRRSPMIPATVYIVQQAKTRLKTFCERGSFFAHLVLRVLRMGDAASCFASS